jgi:hypothetical protein
MRRAKLWRDHEATPGQKRHLSHRDHPPRRVTQADLLLAKLRDARVKGCAVQLPEIMAAGIAQHSARFNEIRARGYVVRNEIERRNGLVLSRYYLEHDPERDGSL